MLFPLLALAALCVSIGAPSPDAGTQGGTANGRGVETAQPNDNRTAAGVLRYGILTVRLEVRRAMWYPEGPGAPGLDVFAFAEEGRAAQIPAPLLRVPEGTQLRVMLRNPLDRTLTVYGLARRPRAASGHSGVRLAPGEEREVVFETGAPAATTTGARSASRATRQPRSSLDLDSQLGGGLIVDPAGVSGPPADRVLVISHWAPPGTPPPVGRLDPEELRTMPQVFAINGLSWPHTERFAHSVGDTVRWRMLNINDDVHPMHLHGFYFLVEQRADGLSDARIGAGAGRRVVTSVVAPGSTATFTWVPEKPGNWLFHCHFTLHFLPSTTLRPTLNAAHDGHGSHDAEQGMGGLVIGVQVAPRAEAEAAAESGPRRKLRLVAQVADGGTVEDPAFGYVLHEDGPDPQPGGDLLPGPMILLRRGEPVSIQVVNRLPEPTGVHWHGIELDSYYDGVPGFSGSSGRLSPLIAPADSFEARFTPPRAGTFIYHTHVDEGRQQPAGLTGALLVLHPDRPYDPQTDRTFLITTPRSRKAAGSSLLINGRSEADLVELRAGTTYRLRFINISFGRPGIRVLLSDEAGPVQWRAVAKDGADLPAAEAHDVVANQSISIGETYDFEFTPSRPGELKLEVWIGTMAGRLAHAPVVVRQSQ